jgi:outer membrane immunogenic protein
MQSPEVDALFRLNMLPYHLGKKRRVMKLSRLTCLLSLACVLIFSQIAPAAECGPSFDWTGPYAGVHLGYGLGNADTDVNPLPLPRISTDQAPSTLSPGRGGVVGGGQLGYNYQVGRFVAGVETDFSGSGMSGSKSVSPILLNNGATFQGVVSAHENTNWYGTLRPRLGYTVQPTLLVYATGGLAYGDVSYSANTNFGQQYNSYPASLSTTKVGWALGGGIEYAVSRCWTVRFEYLHMDLGSESVTAGPVSPNPPYTEGYSWKTTANIFNVGVNYKF